MQGKFKFSLDGMDATARQFAEIRRQLAELPASVGKSVSRLGAGESNAVVVPAHGGAGVRNAYDNPLSSTPRKPVDCLHDGTLGSDCSSAYSVTNVGDADEFIPVDALRQVKWRVYMFKDDLNLKLDDTQPVVGLLAEDLDNAGLGFFCEYDANGNPSGVDYPRLSVAALRLAQQTMGEVDELKAEVSRLSSLVGKMGVSTSD
jgi:hypothetical protein|nr:MAG TPA: Receptor recognition protein, Long tail, Helical sandwich, Tail fiber [Caudoviricetes sp.]